MPVHHSRSLRLSCSGNLSNHSSCNFQHLGLCVSICFPTDWDALPWHDARHKSRSPGGHQMEARSSWSPIETRPHKPTLAERHDKIISHGTTDSSGVSGSGNLWHGMFARLCLSHGGTFWWPDTCLAVWICGLCLNHAKAQPYAFPIVVSRGTGGELLRAGHITAACRRTRNTACTIPPGV